MSRLPQYAVLDRVETAARDLLRIMSEAGATPRHAGLEAPRVVRELIERHPGLGFAVMSAHIEPGLSWDLVVPAVYRIPAIDPARSWSGDRALWLGSEGQFGPGIGGHSNFAPLTVFDRPFSRVDGIDTRRSGGTDQTRTLIYVPARGGRLIDRTPPLFHAETLLAELTAAVGDLNRSRAVGDLRAAGLRA